MSIAFGGLALLFAFAVGLVVVCAVIVGVLWMVVARREKRG
jgi:hypothetical protein